MAGLAGLDGRGPRTPLSGWLDALFVIMLETPVEDIKKVEDALTAVDAQIDPKAARETWGITPEQQALGGGLLNG
jgi:hypothetical protein